MDRTVLFQESEIAEQIMQTDQVGAIKRLGRSVRRYEEHIWAGRRRIIEWRGQNLLGYALMEVRSRLGK